MTVGVQIPETLDEKSVKSLIVSIDMNITYRYFFSFKTDILPYIFGNKKSIISLKYGKIFKQNRVFNQFSEIGPQLSISNIGLRIRLIMVANREISDIGKVIPVHL